MKVKSSSSDFDEEIENANLAVVENLENAYCRHGAKHRYISLEGSGLVSDSKKQSAHLFWILFSNRKPYL